MRRLILFLPLICLFFACPNEEDTCRPLGDTFMSVELAANAIASLPLELVTLDTLPEAYFAEASLVRLDMDQNGNAFDNLAGASTITWAAADSLHISLPTPANTPEEVGLSIRYRDRREFVDCQHPGSGDEYVLFLFFTYLPDGQVEDFSWVEDFRPGGF